MHVLPAGMHKALHELVEKPLESFQVHHILHIKEGMSRSMPGTLPPPLGGPAPIEIFLSRSPLVGVVMQARFSSVLKIDSKEGVAPFQEEMRGHYPLLEQAIVHQLQIDLGAGAPGVRPTSAVAWRFRNADHSTTLTLTSDAVTLETRQYSGRDSFIEGWSHALSVVERLYAPGLAMRLGARYLNRLECDALAHLADWVTPKLVGIVQPALQPYISQAISEASLKVEEGDLLLRWGIMPPGATVDATLMQPCAGASWILDIDATSSRQVAFSHENLTAQFRTLAERAYAVFRYSITPMGLDYFGASQ